MTSTSTSVYCWFPFLSLWYLIFVQ